LSTATTLAVPAQVVLHRTVKTVTVVLILIGFCRELGIHDID